MPPGRWESGISVRPFRRTGRARTRGSPGGGAPTSSSSGTWCARASASSSSRVGLRPPDSSRDSVLTEMPVVSASSASVAPRCWRIERSRGPTASSTGSWFISLLLLRQDNLSNRSLLRDGQGMNENYDVVVVGGGAAGLSGAVALARSRRSVLVVDAGDPRNAPAGHVHNYLGREGTPPAELLAAGRAARWGRDVLHCPYCHGYEARDQAIGILASAAPTAVHQALLFRQLSDDVTVFLHTVADLPPDAREQLAARGVAVVEGEVAAVEVV